MPDNHRILQSSTTQRVEKNIMSALYHDGLPQAEFESEFEMKLARAKRRARRERAEFVARSFSNFWRALRTGFSTKTDHRPASLACSACGSLSGCG
jgi:hypothetical protein